MQSDYRVILRAGKYWLAKDDDGKFFIGRSNNDNSYSRVFN